ncbi:MAG: hypothetical protein JZU53_07140 [Paludibacter sp.]|nr:hypothetical protein [Paludibacter sp.]
MKELPYFRFTPSEWQNGKISLEDYNLQGFFLQVCCYYWISDCSITLAMLQKRYRHDLELIEQCFSLEIFQHNEDTDFITISFLNEQFDSLSEARKKRQSAGSKGGKKKKQNSSIATTKPQQNPSYKDKDNNKDNYNDKEKIKEEIPPFSQRFKLDILEVEEFLKSEQVWKESICMQNKITIEKLDEKIEEFVKTLIGRGEETKSLNESKSHFYNWYNNQKNGTRANRSSKGINEESANFRGVTQKREIKSAI